MDVHEIRHGYNLADLDQLAHAAVHRGARSGIVPADELHAAAWHAIAEHLCTADDRPRPYDLVGTGLRAIAEAIQQGNRAHGWDWERRNLRPRFVTFWTDLGTPTPSPEKRIIDQTALWQIWPTLSDGRRAALLALAAHGDYRTAAASLGLSYKTFHQRIRDARHAFLTAWHEGEVPSGTWSYDRRQWRGDRAVKERRLVDHARIKKAKRARKAAA